VNKEVLLPDGTVMWSVQRVIMRFKNGPEDGIQGYGLSATGKWALLGYITPA
jgi:hypothetical protein